MWDTHRACLLEDPRAVVWREFAVQSTSYTHSSEQQQLQRHNITHFSLAEKQQHISSHLCIILHQIIFFPWGFLVCTQESRACTVQSSHFCFWRRAMVHKQRMSKSSPFFAPDCKRAARTGETMVTGGKSTYRGRRKWCQCCYACTNWSKGTYYCHLLTERYFFFPESQKRTKTLRKKWIWNLKKRLQRSNSTSIRWSHQGGTWPRLLLRLQYSDGCCLRIYTMYVSIHVCVDICKCIHTKYTYLHTYLEYIRVRNFFHKVSLYDSHPTVTHPRLGPLFPGQFRFFNGFSTDNASQVHIHTYTYTRRTDDAIQIDIHTHTYTHITDDASKVNCGFPNRGLIWPREMVSLFRCPKS